MVPEKPMYTMVLSSVLNVATRKKTPEISWQLWSVNKQPVKYLGDSNAQPLVRAQGHKVGEIVTPRRTSKVFADYLSYIVNYVGHH